MGAASPALAAAVAAADAVATPSRRHRWEGDANVRRCRDPGRSSALAVAVVVSAALVALAAVGVAQVEVPVPGYGEVAQAVQGVLLPVKDLCQEALEPCLLAVQVVMAGAPAAVAPA